jgi:hypothetical protein
MVTDRDWFDLGWAAYKDGRRDADSFPPLSDREGQRRTWLGAFGAARAAGPDEAGSVDELRGR